MNKQSIILIFYSLFLIAFSCFSYIFIDPNLIYLKSIFTNLYNTERFITSSIYILFLCIFFAFYLYFISLKRINANKIIVISCLGLLFSYPAMLSYDIFNYMATAKVTFFYGENPYLVMPIEFIGDPMLLYTRAANKFALYGPFWIGITYVPYFLGSSNFLFTLFSFKVIVLPFFMLTCYFLHKISKDIRVVAFFALNPLVLIETFVSSHNDIVMMSLALMALYFVRQKKIFSSLLFLCLSVLIKFATLFLFPVWLYIVVRKKYDWKKTWLYSGFAMFIIFLLTPVREEMYPWYSIWFIVFAALTDKKLLKEFIIAFSFGLLLRYVPYMYLGTYFGIVPILRIILMALPVFGYFCYIFITRRRWEF